MSQRGLSRLFGAVTELSASPQQLATWARFASFRVRGRLFTKYVALFVAVVCVALVTNASFEIWFFYQEHKDSLIRIQREQAEAASAKIEQFVDQIEAQLGWTTQLPWIDSTLQQRRIDSQRDRLREHTDREGPSSSLSHGA